MNGDGKLDLIVANGGDLYGRDRGINIFLGNGDGTFRSAINYQLGAGDLAVGDFNGDGSLDLAKSMNNGVAILLNQSTGSIHHFAISAPSGANAGQSFNITVTALNDHNARVTDYQGSVHFASSDRQVMPGNGLPDDYTFKASDRGVHTFTVTLRTAGHQVVSVADRDDPTKTGTATVMVNPGIAAKLSIHVPPGTIRAGTPFNATVSALDAFDNVATGYRGMVHFSSDGVAMLPGDYRFTAADNGTQTFQVTLKTVGTQSITARDTADGRITGSATVTASPALLTITPAAGQAKLYGAAVPVLTYMATGFINGDTASLIRGLLGTTATPTSPVGHYPFTLGTLSAGPSYTLVLASNSPTFAVTPAPLTVTAATASRGYGQANPAFTGTLTGVVAGDHITATYASAATPKTGVGVYGPLTAQAITPMLNDPDHRLSNYTVTKTNGTLTIIPAPLTIAADNKTKVYGQANPVLTATYTGFVNGDTPAVISGLTLSTTAGSGIGIGTYAIAAAGARAANYTITYMDGTLTVTRAPLTITADNQGKVYGQANPVLTATYTGFVNGDTPAVVSGLTLSTTATAGSGVGIYAITAVGATAANYTIAFVNGTLTVNRAPLTITAENQTRVAGTTVTLTATYTGLVNGDTPAVVSGLTLSTYPGATAGTYPITARGATSANYAITHVHGTLTIIPATASQLLLTAPAAATAQGLVRVAITAFDPFGNTATGYSGTVRLISSDAQAMFPATVTLANGTATLTISWKTPGSQNLTATDTLVNSITGSATVKVIPLASENAFVIGLDDQVYSHKFDTDGNPKGGYFLTQPGRVKSLTVGHTAAGNPELFVVGLDNQVYAQKFNSNGDSASSYFLVQPGQVKALTVGSAADNSPELFVIGLDDQVYAQKLDATGNVVVGYFLVQPGRVKQLVVGQDAAQHPELFVIGLDDQVYAQKLDAAGNSSGSYFLTQAGHVKDLAVTHDASNHPELFVIGLDNQVYAQQFDAVGNSASNYFLTQPGQVQALSASHDTAGNPELFVIGLDDQVYAQKFDAFGSASAGYFLTQPGRVKALDAAFEAAGNPELFVIGLDDQIYAHKLDAFGSSLGTYFLMDGGKVNALSTVK